METFIEHPVFTCSIASLLMTFAWSVLNIQRKQMLVISICFTALSVALFYSYYLIPIRWFEMIGVRLQLLSPLMLLLTLVFVVGGIKGKQVVSGVSYLLSILYLLAGLEALKSAGGTWGNSNLGFGMYIAFNALLILQLLTYICESNFFYGTLKLLLGIASTVILIVWGLNRGDEYWVGDVEVMSRKSVVLVTAIMIVEGLLLLYKAKKNPLLKRELR